MKLQNAVLKTLVAVGLGYVTFIALKKFKAMSERYDLICPEDETLPGFIAPEEKDFYSDMIQSSENPCGFGYTKN